MVSSKSMRAQKDVRVHGRFHVVLAIVMCEYVLSIDSASIATMVESRLRSSLTDGSFVDGKIWTGLDRYLACAREVCYDRVGCRLVVDDINQ